MKKAFILKRANDVSPTGYLSKKSLLKALMEGSFKQIKTVEGSFDYSPDHVKQLADTCLASERSYVCSLDGKLDIFLINLI